jgi:Tfp pilus assembly protein PilN
MSNYRNIEVNLLPPELQPPPTVRTAVILNAALVLGVLTYMTVFTFKAFNDIKVQQEQIEEAKTQIKNQQPIVDMYAALQDVHEQVNEYGRLVSLASVDYVDVPVLLDRIAKIIPAGVYLSSISNGKSSPNSQTTLVQVTMLTTSNDSALIQSTLDAFKKDAIFEDSFMRGAEVRKESLNSRLAEYDVKWSATGPGIPQSLDVNKYEFTVLANVPKLVDTVGLPVVSDRSIFLADVKFKTPPPPEEVDKNGKPIKAKAGSEAPREPELDAKNAPEGVKPVGVN